MREKQTMYATESGEPADLSVLEDAQVAYDPTATQLDLTKDEKRRTTSLMMAIQAYREFIIRDADMYREIRKDAERGDGPPIKPATMNAIVEAAMQFDYFISGRLQAELAKQEEEKESANG